MSGAIPPFPQYAFMAWYLVKCRDNFTFTFMWIAWTTSLEREFWYFIHVNHFVSTVATPLYIREAEIFAGCSIKQLRKIIQVGHNRLHNLSLWMLESICYFYENYENLLQLCTFWIHHNIITCPSSQKRITQFHSHCPGNRRKFLCDTWKLAPKNRFISTPKFDYFLSFPACIYCSTVYVQCYTTESSQLPCQNGRKQNRTVLLSFRNYHLNLSSLFSDV